MCVPVGHVHQSDRHQQAPPHGGPRVRGGARLLPLWHVGCCSVAAAAVVRPHEASLKGPPGVQAQGHWALPGWRHCCYADHDVSFLPSPFPSPSPSPSLCSVIIRSFVASLNGADKIDLSGRTLLPQSSCCPESSCCAGSSVVLSHDVSLNVLLSLGLVFILLWCCSAVKGFLFLYGDVAVIGTPKD